MEMRIRRLAAGFGCIASSNSIRRFSNTCCKLTGSGIHHRKIWSESRLDGSGAPQQIGIEQSQDFPDESHSNFTGRLVPRSCARNVNPVNDIARSPGISRNIGEQLVKHLEVGGTLHQKSSSGCRVAGNGGEWLIEFVRDEALARH